MPSVSAYSEWIDVPDFDSSQDIPEITDGVKFQIRTDAALSSGNMIRLMLIGSSYFLTFDNVFVNAQYCGYSLTGNEGFISKGGVLTFLKSTTQLEVWFDDVLEVTWVYEDKSATEECQMRGTMTALKFHGSSTDTASVQYRYELPEPG